MQFFSAPSSPLTVVVVGRLTSATLSWQALFGYEAVALSGGVLYRVMVENTVTGQQNSVTTSETTITQTLVHSTKYCFRVRAEVSGGAGDYSERACYTTPGMTAVPYCLY